MPSSTDYALARVLWAIRWLKPESILDVGCGNGKYGVLFRITLEEELSSLKGIATQIIGIDAFLPQKTHWHNYYDHIIINDLRNEISDLPNYDLIYLGDVIEHFDKKEGYSLLFELISKAKIGVLVTTPYHFLEQGAVGGNELEVHKSLWTKRDFRRFPHHICWVEYRKKLVVFLSEKRIPAFGWYKFKHRSFVSSFLERSVFFILGFELARRLKKIFIKKNDN